MFFGKRLVRVDIVGAKPINADADCVKLRNSITEFRCFDGLAVGVVLGIDEDNVAAAEQPSG